MNEVDTERSAIEFNLVRAIERGDRDALRELYFDYYPRLGRFLAHCAVSPDLIDEMIVGIFQIVFQSAQSLRGDQRVSTWILRITYLAVKEAFGAVLPPAQARPALLSHPPYPDRKPDSGDVLGAALQGLPLDQRITFLLAYQMGLSVECIEEITRCPNLVVISRLALARKVVAQVVDAYTSEDDKDHVGARRHRLHLA